MSCKVAVLGCGHWGENLASNFAEQYSVASLSEDDQDHFIETAEAALA